MTHGFVRDKSQTRAGGRYDSRHKRARAAAARRHHDTDPCTRCGHPLGPLGPWLHYDHDTDGPNGEPRYLGFAHGTCNTRAGSAEGNRRQGLTPEQAQQRYGNHSRRATRHW